MPTQKHNMRIPDDVWDAACGKADRLADLGYRGENGPLSTTDLVRASLRLAGTETVEQTVLRLGLSRDASPTGPDPDRWMTSAETAS